MSVFKTTFSRALRVNPSDDSNIPFPIVIESGTTTNSGPSQLIDANALFVTNGVKTGDIVISDSNDVMVTIVEVIDENTLLLNANLFSLGYEYVVYQASSQSGLGNQGCYLYIGDNPAGGGAVTVTTIGGDIITFNGLASGTILPVQVIKLHATGTSDVAKINALW